LTVEVDRQILADLLVSVARAAAALKALAAIHTKEEAKLLIKVAIDLKDIHKRIVSDVYGITSDKD
jgi:ribosome recycling factor